MSLDSRKDIAYPLFKIRRFYIFVTIPEPFTILNLFFRSSNRHVDTSALWTMLTRAPVAVFPVSVTTCWFNYDRGDGHTTDWQTYSNTIRSLLFYFILTFQTLHVFSSQRFAFVLLRPPALISLIIASPPIWTRFCVSNVCLGRPYQPSIRPPAYVCK